MSKVGAIVVVGTKCSCLCFLNLWISYRGRTVMPHSIPVSPTFGLEWSRVLARTIVLFKQRTEHFPGYVDYPIGSCVCIRRRSLNIHDGCNSISSPAPPVPHAFWSPVGSSSLLYKHVLIGAVTWGKKRHWNSPGQMPAYKAGGRPRML